MVLIFTITDEHQQAKNVYTDIYRGKKLAGNLEALWDWINHPLSNLLKLKHMSPNEANKILYTDIDIADYPSKISKDELLHNSFHYKVMVMKIMRSIICGFH